ncbi:SgcJ/EcaC family oxidoreductase [Bosea sp. LjRoot237]|uniref:SgcJ/EcaC family oxidoreductase n=1 Tax=Bosea sp. LjRoot237 TaxID=3342292 RepID=UPI003ECD10DE
MARNFHPLGSIRADNRGRAPWRHTLRGLAVLIIAVLELAMASTQAARAQMVPASDLARPSEAADRVAIAELFIAWESAWNTHDMKAFANLYHEDCIFIAWTGAKWLSRDMVEKGHAEVHKTVFRDSAQRKRIDSIHFLAPDVALVHLWSTLTGDTRQPDKVVRSRNTLILTKRDGEWKILSFQNTRLADNVPD